MKLVVRLVSLIMNASYTLRETNMKKIYVGVALLFFLLSFCPCALGQQGKGPASADTQAHDTHSGQTKEADTTINQGNGEAERVQADKHYYGKGATQSFTEAHKLYLKGAEQGNVASQSMLGFLYYYGQGVSQDYTEATQWFRKAAEQGNAASQGMLGMAYYFGEGAPQSYKTAAKWFRKAAAQEDALSLGMLGVMYDKGQSVTQNYKKAAEWYKKAVAQGNDSVQPLLDKVLEKIK